MLQGTLNDFSLPDVFSLLALTKKSGALHVATGGIDGRVFFRDGAVCLALSDARRVPLVARLVSAGLVGEPQLRSLLEDHTGSSVAVTEAIITSGQVEDRILSVFLREQIVDAVFELLRLTEGDFSFDATQPGLSRGVSLSVTEVVGEANRRLEEWHLISRRIASPAAVLAMVPSAMDGRDGVNLASEQWDLLALIDGHRTVAEVVELTGKGEFATCRVLGDLVEAGLVEAQDPATGGKTRLAALIAARETLRSLEQVEKAGALHPELSSARLDAAGAGVRWIEPTVEPDADEHANGHANGHSHANGHGTTNGEPAKLARLTPRTKSPEVPLHVEEPAADTPAPAAAVSAAPEPPAPSVEAAKVESKPVSAGSPSAPSPRSSRSSAAVNPNHETTAAPPPQPAPPSETASAPAEPAKAHTGLDRADFARELASLGIDDGPVIPAPDRSRLTRDEDVNKGLLLRLIDGVKGA
jgi:hypothetical protein